MKEVNKKEIRYMINEQEMDMVNRAKRNDRLEPISDCSYAKLILLRYLRDKGGQNESVSIL